MVTRKPLNLDQATRLLIARCANSDEKIITLDIGRVSEILPGTLNEYEGYIRFSGDQGLVFFDRKYLEETAKLQNSGTNISQIRNDGTTTALSGKSQNK